jgi:hypothetical protein
MTLPTASCVIGPREAYTLGFGSASNVRMQSVHCVSTTTRNRNAITQKIRPGTCSLHTPLLAPRSGVMAMYPVNPPEKHHFRVHWRIFNPSRFTYMSEIRFIDATSSLSYCCVTLVFHRHRFSSTRSPPISKNPGTP